MKGRSPARSKAAGATADATIDDRALVARLLDGDDAAFALLVGRYHARLVRLARTFVGDETAAEEVTQDTWLAVVEGLPRFEARASLKTWIFRILANRARTRGGRDARSIPLSALGDATSGDDGPTLEPERFLANGHWASPVAPWSVDDPEALSLRREAMAHLADALETLPPNQRMVVLLHDVEQLEPAEVCNILAVSETNQRVLLHRARARLRDALAQRLGT